MGADRRWGISSSVDPDGDAKKKSTSERILDVLREADHPLRMSEVYRTMRDPVRIESDRRRASVVEAEADLSVAHDGDLFDGQDGAKGQIGANTATELRRSASR